MGTGGQAQTHGTVVLLRTMHRPFQTPDERLLFIKGIHASRVRRPSQPCLP